MSDEGAVSRLAEAFGVMRSYRDFGGRECPTSPETDRALLKAMGAGVETESDAEAALVARQAAAKARLGPAETIVESGAPAAIPSAAPADWEIVLEGERDAAVTGRGAVAPPPLPMGVHRLVLTHGETREDVRLIAAPARAPSVAEATGAERIWGLATALYGLTSERNAGLGDYADLGAMAAAAARNGADFLGINPVHALGAAAPAAMISPYSPSHRGFLDTRHIALDDLAPYGGGASATAPPRASADSLINHEAATAIREPALDAAFEAFEALRGDHPARKDFARFAAEGGDALFAHALFETISLKHGADWRLWPAPLQDIRGAAVAAIAAETAKDVRRHQWRQWVAAGQLEKAQAGAKAAGMRLGLYLDIAVGARPGGGETWANPGAHTSGATLGAPPDPFSDQMQSWGLAPFSPLGLEAEGYRSFSGLLAAAMRHAGMIRIDHILGFARSFWIPEDGAPGAYVRYPLEALLAVTRIEAARAGCVVVGEDLGLVPERLREALTGSGVYGIDVMQFERDGTGAFRPPEAGRRDAVASFATHDAPTVAGFFAGTDLDWRVRLGRMEASARERTMSERLAAEVSLGAPTQAAERRNAIHARLAASPAAMCAVQLDDLGDMVEQQNLPGTVDEHPNWRRRAAIPVETAPDAPGMTETARIMAAAGRGAPKG